MKTFAAPWSARLVVVSSLVTALCLGIAIGSARQANGGPLWLVLLPVVFVCGGALSGIRGYTIAPRALLIHRLLWTTRLSLEGLQTARVAPQAMDRSIRAFGNGGFFSFSGWFYSRALGRYRAFVTDPYRTVVLNFLAKTVVV